MIPYDPESLCEVKQPLVATQRTVSRILGTFRGGGEKTCYPCVSLEGLEAVNGAELADGIWRLPKHPGGNGDGKMVGKAKGNGSKL